MKQPDRNDLLRDPDDNGRLDDPIPTSNALVPVVIILAGFTVMVSGLFALIT